MTATVISYPNNEINETLDILDTNNSYELVQNIWVNVADTTSDEYIEITYNSEVITLYIQEECRYTPVDIFFINKEGGLQSLTFFKAKRDSLSVTDSEYESDRLQPNLGAHQYTKYNKQGRESFTVNSGFLEEEVNETFKQLFLSERVWIFENSQYTPINVQSKELAYKTRQNDRLISYEVNFQYAFNAINNI